jgi:acyl-coenzyme A synthetase/AMP-(fatty) acid ligase
MPSLHQSLATRNDEVCLFHGRQATTGRQIVDLGNSLVSKMRQDRCLVVLSLAHDLRFLLALISIVEVYPLHLVLGRDAEARAQAETCLTLDAILHPDGTWEYCAPRQMHEPGEAGVLLFTSGTTGKPKLVHHSWGALVDGVFNASLEKHRDARWLVTYQPHSFAALQVILSAVLSGGSLVMPERREASAYVKAVAEHAPTHISATPTFWRAFLLAADRQTFPSIQQISLGGEAVDQSTLNRLKMAFPFARLSHIYASSEAGTVFSVHDGKAGFPLEWLDREIHGGIRLRIRNGMLEILTRRRMRAYTSGQPSPISEDGWLISGDLVEQRGDRIAFCGRADRIVNVGGLKVSPDEIESFLLTHPDVREAQVYPIPSPFMGQLVGVRVVLDPGSDQTSVLADVRRYCAANLAPHKWPRSIECVPHITISESGKKL